MNDLITAHLNYFDPSLVQDSHTNLYEKVANLAAEELGENIAMPELEKLVIDQHQGILQFGQDIGEENYEVSSGFVISMQDDRIVNAWVKLVDYSAATKSDL